MEYRPRGGFMNFLQGVDGAATSPFGPSMRPQHPAYQMHHFPMPYTHFMGPPPPPGNTHSSPMTFDSRSPSPANIGQHRVTIDVEATDDDSRQRMYYTPEEDVSLVSAWLNNSTDPIEGNSKKLARYWEEVAAAYNLTAPSDRKRTVKHLKNHWYKTTKKVSGFNGCYNQLEGTCVSGRSDEQLMEEALELYRSRYKHHFTYVHWWKIVRDSPKWNAHIAAELQGTKRSSDELDANRVVPNVRPVGCKKAKKMKGAANGSATTVVEEQLEKLVNAQSEITEGINNMKDFQERISNQKVEAAKLTYMAAKENKESKVLENNSKTMEHREKMMERFSEMLKLDTSQMESWAKEAHVRAVTALGDELFGRDGSA